MSSATSAIELGSPTTGRLRGFALALSLATLLGSAVALLPEQSSFAATHTVSNCNNSGLGSLRNAISLSSTGDTVDFSVTCTSTPITLATTIHITKSITISGPGPTKLLVSGNNSVAMFVVNSSVTVSISGLTVEKGGPVFGSAIYNQGTATLNRTVFSDNGEDGLDNAGTLTLTNSTVSGNTSNGIFTGTTLTLNNSNVSGNGGDGIDNGTFGTATLNNSTVSDNLAGIVNGHMLQLNNSTVSGSTNDGIDNNGTATANNSTLSNNGGAGIDNSGTATLNNSTVSGSGNGHGFDGIYNTGTTTVNNSTIFGNGGFGIEPIGTVSLLATIVAENVVGDCAAAVTDAGYNIDDDGTCGFSTPSISDSLTLDSTLGPLFYNGGPTETVALLPHSPAIDQVPSVDCPSSGTDQRGTARSAPCDIGAFDTDGNGLLPLLRVLDAPTTATRWNPYTVTVEALNPDGTIDRSFSGNVNFVSTDPQAILPAPSTLSGGVGTFSVTLKTPGSQSVTAFSNPFVGASEITTVGNPSFRFSVPGVVSPGHSFSFTITALNADGTVDTTYPNKVHFSSSGSAVLPANSKLTSGAKTFSAKLSGPGPQTITVNDTIDPSVTDTSPPIDV